MQQIDPTYSPVHGDDRRRQYPRRRLIPLLLAILVILVLALLPPLISINRFQHRIITGVSLSLGRPVHLDHVSLNLLPLPSLTIDNLVVDEDPSFGSEPIIRSRSVTARLRVSSLWRRQVEFSRIDFLDPSINLVHNPDGRWNVENVLLQAARIEAAPTDQKQAGASPRFPYIEATGARLNLKLGREKTPFSLTEAEFALWLPSPNQWRLRLKARPARTDTDVSDTGSMQIEAILGRPATLGQVPISLQGAWRNVPLGEASRVLLGRDAGLRGEMTLMTDIQGTIGESALKATLHVDDLRRSDFVPEHAVAMDLECQAQAAQSFHAFETVRCSWPLAGTASALALTASIPDVRRPSASSFQIGTPGLQASTLLQWMRVASDRIPPSLTATGTLTGSLAREPSTSSIPSWSGQAAVKELRLSSSQIGESPVTLSDLTLEIASPRDPDLHHARSSASPDTPAVLLEPTAITLGGKDPALLEGRIDLSGYHLHLSGMIVLSRLLALGASLPQLGDGLVDVLSSNQAFGPVRLDLTANRTWGGPQTWSDTTSRAAFSSRSNTPTSHAHSPRPARHRQQSRRSHSR